MDINDKHYLEYKFIARIKGDQKPKIKEDIHENFIWLPIKDYKKYPLAPYMKTFCEEFLNGNYS